MRDVWTSKNYTAKRTSHAVSTWKKVCCDEASMTLLCHIRQASVLRAMAVMSPRPINAQLSGRKSNKTSTSIKRIRSRITKRCLTNKCNRKRFWLSRAIWHSWRRPWTNKRWKISKTSPISSMLWCLECSTNPPYARVRCPSSNSSKFSVRCKWVPLGNNSLAPTTTRVRHLATGGPRISEQTASSINRWGRWMRPMLVGRLGAIIASQSSNVRLPRQLGHHCSRAR